MAIGAAPISSSSSNSSSAGGMWESEPGTSPDTAVGNIGLIVKYSYANGVINASAIAPDQVIIQAVVGE